MTWGIPENYGGMTTALLQRSRAFVRLGGAEVDVLTFDPEPRYAGLEAAMLACGELVEGMRLRNLYEWLRTEPLPGGTLRHPFTPLPASDAGVLLQGRLAPDGTVLQSDHYRADGTLLLSHRRDVRVPGVIGGRSVVLCDERGVPVRSWGRIHHLYGAWLDRLTAGKPSWMVVDSKSIATFMMGYRRPHVTTVHVVHNAHLVAGEVRASRRAVVENLSAFDGVALLTPRQRGDVQARFGASNLEVVPNASPPVARARAVRDPRRGVVLASLTARKRVDHAIRAAALVGARLDVYGDGELHDLLPRGENVVLHGHVPGARSELGAASFLLATGSSEGFPLVLAEAMAAGCIPIAYDVDYGPADLIDGVNGILVPDGDEAALAAAVASLLAETPAQLARRRRHARRTAARYTDAAITAHWADVLRAASARHAEGVSPRLAASRSSWRPGVPASPLPSPR